MACLFPTGHNNTESNLIISNNIEADDKGSIFLFFGISIFPSLVSYGRQNFGPPTHPLLGESSKN